MKAPKDIFLAITLLLFFHFLSCSKKGILFNETPPFTIVKPYMQKIVPGLKEAKPFVEIGFEIKDLSKKVILDSLSYNGRAASKMYAIGLKRTVSFEISQALLDKDELRLFYSKGKRQYYTLIKQIELKEDLLHP